MDEIKEYVNATNGFLFLIFIVVLRKFYSSFTQKHLPGPRRWPFLGTTLSFDMTRMMHDDQLLQVARRYGDICALRAFGEDFILLNSYDVIREAAILKSNDFVNRPLGKRFTWMQVDPNNEGIAFNDYENVKKTRNASVRIFRDLGVGRSTMENVVTEEARILIDQFKSCDGNAFNPLDDVTFCVANVLQNFLFQERSKICELQTIFLNMKITEQSFVFIFLFDSLPFMRHFPGLRKHFQAIVNPNIEIMNLMLSKAYSCVVNLDTLNNPSSFVEAFAQKYGKDSHEFRKVLPQNLMEFFAAGTDRTSSALKWTLCLLANRQKTQKKLHNAIRNVIGPDGNYSLACKIPYLDAVILEVLRYCVPSPIALPHCVSTNEKVTLGGHVVPNDATYIFNLFAVHRDPKTWGDPEQFRPERFLDDDGNFVKHPHVIPFVLGKRSCPGELLARQLLYIFIANIFQKFHILPPEGVEKVSEEAAFGIVRGVKNFQIRAVEHL